MSLINSFLAEEQRVGIKKGLGIIRPILLFILKLSFIPIIFACLLGYYFRKKESEKGVNYFSTVSFVESKKINSPISSAISSQLNIIRGAGQEDSEGVIDAIVKSDRVMAKAFFFERENTDSTLLINELINQYFEDEPYRFSRPVLLDSMTLSEKSIYKRVQDLVTNEKTGLFNFESSETVQKINVSTKDERLTYDLANSIYESLANFYDSNKSESIENSMELLVHKRDSTKAVLQSLNKKLAAHNDKSGLYRTPSKNLKQVNLAREIMITEIQYNQLHAQVEAFEISNTDGHESYFQKLNYPILPLVKSKKEILKQTAIGGVIGFVVGFFLIILLFVFTELIRFLKELNKS